MSLIIVHQRTLTDVITMTTHLLAASAAVFHLRRLQIKSCTTHTLAQKRRHRALLAEKNSEYLFHAVVWDVFKVDLYMWWHFWRRFCYELIAGFHCERSCRSIGIAIECRSLN